MNNGIFTFFNSIVLLTPCRKEKKRNEITLDLWETRFVPQERILRIIHRVIISLKENREGRDKTRGEQFYSGAPLQRIRY